MTVISRKQKEINNKLLMTEKSFISSNRLFFIGTEGRSTYVSSASQNKAIKASNLNTWIRNYKSSIKGNQADCLIGSG